ncbi:MAG: nucleotidyltransferase domain-containing protein [Acidobacteriota bacterium]
MRHRASRHQVEAVLQITPPRRLTLSQRRKQIRTVCDAIAREFHPEKIILFGSFAYGKPRPDSDVDLLVVMPFEGSPFRQASLILSHVVSAVGVLPMDLLARTSEQVEERLKMGDSFMREIIERGKIIYEADHV